MPSYNKTQRLNLRNHGNLTRASQNNSTGVKATRNPLNGAVMGYNNYWKGKRQYVDYLIKYGKISEEQGEKYLKLISNNNKTLNNTTKKALKPWLLPEAPPGFKAHPPSYLRKTLKAPNNIRKNNDPRIYNTNSGKNSPMAQDPVQQGGKYRVYYGKITNDSGKPVNNSNFSKGNSRGFNAYWQDINSLLEKHVAKVFLESEIMSSGFGGDDGSGVVVVSSTKKIPDMKFTIDKKNYTMTFGRYENSD